MKIDHFDKYRQSLVKTFVTFQVNYGYREYYEKITKCFNRTRSIHKLSQRMINYLEKSNRLINFIIIII